MPKKSTTKVDWLREMRERNYDDARFSGKQPDRSQKKRNDKKSDKG